MTAGVERRGQLRTALRGIPHGAGSITHLHASLDRRGCTGGGCGCKHTREIVDPDRGIDDFGGRCAPRIPG
jgi:hypothetical protein